MRLILPIFALVLVVDAEKSAIRGGHKVDGPEPKLLAEVNLLENAKVEFFEAEDAIIVSAGAGEDEAVQLKEILELAYDDPVDLFKHLTKGNTVPHELEEANNNVMRLREEQAKISTDFAKDVMSHAPPPEEETSDFVDDQSLEANNDDGLVSRALYTSYGSSSWWRQNFCSSKTHPINQNECQCFDHVWGDRSNWYYDNKLHVGVFANQNSGIGLSVDYWTCSNGPCRWVQKLYAYTPLRWWRTMWISGANNYYRGRVSYASGDQFHWSINTHDESSTCGNGVSPCSFCSNPYQYNIDLGYNAAATAKKPNFQNAVNKYQWMVYGDLQSRSVNPSSSNSKCGAWPKTIDDLYVCMAFVYSNSGALAWAQTRLYRLGTDWPLPLTGDVTFNTKHIGSQGQKFSNVDFEDLTIHEMGHVVSHPFHFLTYFCTVSLSDTCELSSFFSCCSLVWARYGK